MQKKVKAQDISVNDRVSVFLELAEAHRLLDEKVVKELKMYYKYSVFCIKKLVICFGVFMVSFES